MESRETAAAPAPEETDTPISRWWLYAALALGVLGALGGSGGSILLGALFVAASLAAVAILLQRRPRGGRREWLLKMAVPLVALAWVVLDTYLA